MTAPNSAPPVNNDEIVSATKENEADKVAILLERTPLHESSRSGKKENTRTLLDNGAQANVADKDGDTPLHLAAVNGFTEICLLLIAHGARADFENVARKTAIQSALNQGHTQTASAIQKAISLRNSRRIKNMFAYRRKL